MIFFTATLIGGIDNDDVRGQDIIIIRFLHMDSYISSDFACMLMKGRSYIQDFHSFSISSKLY